MASDRGLPGATEATFVDNPDTVAIPRDVDAERSVLGSMLMSPDAATIGLEILQPGDFYNPHHETIFKTVAKMWAANAPVDAVTVARTLTEDGNLARVGGPAYLHALLAGTPSPAAVDSYARIVAKTAGWRRITEVGAQIARIGFQGGGDLDVAYGEAFGLVQGIIPASSVNTGGYVGDYVDDLIDSMDPAQYQEVQGMSWGWRDVDTVLDPLEPGLLAVIAGRSGVGKSVAAQNVARHVAIRQRRRVLYLSFEMSLRKIHRRLMAAEAKVLLNHIKHRTLSNDEWDRVARARAALLDASLIVDFIPGAGMPKILTKVRQYQPDLLVVDQIPNVTAPNPQEPLNQRYEDIAYGLQALAADQNMAVVALTQLNRNMYQRSEPKPTVSDIRGSDGIYQASDIVVMLHDPTMGKKDDPRAGEIDWIVAKQRDGESDQTATLGSQLHYARFVDLAT